MGSTKTDSARWSFKPELPPEPQHGTPERMAQWARDRSDMKAVYQICRKAANRSAAMRDLMLDGYRFRQVNLSELQRLAELGRQWEQFFGGVQPGQLAVLMDRLAARQNGGQGPVPKGEPATSTEAREVRTKAITELADMTEGELS